MEDNGRSESVEGKGWSSNANAGGVMASSESVSERSRVISGAGGEVIGCATDFSAEKVSMFSLSPLWKMPRSGAMLGCDGEGMRVKVKRWISRDLR